MALKDTAIDEIIENFALLDDWDDRYRYLIELGRQLEPLPEPARNDANKQPVAARPRLATVAAATAVATAGKSRSNDSSCQAALATAAAAALSFADLPSSRDARRQEGALRSVAEAVRRGR